MDKVTAFDALFTNNQIQKLKILISYVDSPLQRQLAVYIKFLELKYTMDLLSHYPDLAISPLQREEQPEPAKLCREVSPYCSSQEQRQLDQLISMLQAMGHYQEIMDMVKTFQDMFPDGISFPGGESSNGESSNGESSNRESSNGENFNGENPGNENTTRGNPVGSPGSRAGGGMNMDMMASLGSLLGENMPDLSQLMSMMSMMQPPAPPPPPPDGDA